MPAPPPAPAAPPPPHLQDFMEDTVAARKWSRCLHCSDLLAPETLFQDKVQTLEGWTHHISWRRHLPEVVTCLRIAAWYWPPVVMVTLISTAIGCYRTWAEPNGWVEVSRHTDYDRPFTFTSFALALLLVFRTNSSYGRWWEARTLWGSLLYVTRSLVRETLAWTSPSDAALADVVVRWTTAMSYCLQAHVREQRSVVASLQDVLTPGELTYLGKRQHLPNGVAAVLSGAVARLDLPPYKRVALEAHVAQFVAVTAGCERILRSPIPIAYTRHTSRYLIVWLMFMPFALWPALDWVAIPASAVIAFLLIGVENIGIQIEQPFAVLPLSHLSAAIKANVLSLRADMAGAAGVLDAAAAAGAHAQGQPDGGVQLHAPPPAAQMKHGPVGGSVANGVGHPAASWQAPAGQANGLPEGRPAARGAPPASRMHLAADSGTEATGGPPVVSEDGRPGNGRPAQGAPPAGQQPDGVMHSDSARGFSNMGATRAALRVQPGARGLEV